MGLRDPFLGGMDLQAEGVNPALHLRVQGRKDHAVPFDERPTGKAPAHNKNLEMGLRSRGNGVIRALIDHLQMLGIEQNANFSFDTLFYGHGL